MRRRAIDRIQRFYREVRLENFTFIGQAVGRPFTGRFSAEFAGIPTGPGSHPLARTAREPTISGMKPGHRIDGFLVRRVTPLPNLRSTAYELLHERSGAKIVHLHNEDAENLFSVTFPTPPPDDTGVPHILEHSVLAGSRKYRVKDPFFEMVKSSMATFINAMTGSDYTVYPVASNVRQDFYNLAEVYWDAVFHPLLTEKTFQREGHHLEIEPSGDLIIKGIVYNEMKGALSSPEAKVYDLMEKNLWPDTPYGRDSGGDPDHIPELTWQGLRHFHASYYHPSNAYIFLYGDIRTEDHLKFLQERLAAFSSEEIRPSLPPQPRWKSPRRLAGVYPVGPADPTSGKSFVVFSWLVGSALDVPDMFALAAMERILLGNQAAPLRKTLIDSKLGEDLTHSGFRANGVDTSFHVGLKGTEGDRADAIEKLVLQTLAEIARKGVARQHFDAAIQQLKYRYLEITPSYPLNLMGSATGLWMHGADPLILFHADQHIANLQRDFQNNGRFFSDLIEKKLLANTHRLTLVVTPDGQIQAKKDAEFTEKMRVLKASLSPSQIEQIKLNQKELEAQLNTPNDPAAIASLPQLRVKDLPPKPRHIHTELENLPGGALLLNNDVFANGVNYLMISFDLTGLPAELLPMLSLYCDCVQKMGAAGQDYAAIAQRVAAWTGGVGCSMSFGTRADDAGKIVQTAAFSTKFLDENAEAALDLLHDLIFAMDPRDEARLKDVLLQARAGQRMRAQHDGMGLALRHAARGINAEGQLQELIAGLPQIHLYEKIAAGNTGPLIEQIDSIRKFLLNRGRVTASFTGSDPVAGLVRRRLIDWSAAMKQEKTADSLAAFAPWKSPPREGLAAPMNVAYCTSAMPAPHMTHPDAPLLVVASRLLSLSYVLEEVRFKGTAYGGGCGYNAAAQTFSFHSYRDPWVNRTLDVYAGALDYVGKADWSQGDVDRSIIGSAKEGERPIRPPQASSTALWRYLVGDTPERREARHTAMLGVTLADVKRVLTEQFEAHAGEAAVCVVSSREKLEEANKQRPDKPLQIEDILQG
jgi:presequence protease